MHLVQLEADGKISFAQDQTGDDHPYAIPLTLGGKIMKKSDTVT
jgi:hypothetical protein